MTIQIERLQAQFYSLNIDQKRSFIEDLQDEMHRSGDPEWRAYLQPFISRCIMEYNEEIQRPAAMPAREADSYLGGGYPPSGYPASAPPPSPSPPYGVGTYPQGSAYESSYHPQSNKLAETLDVITNTVPVAGSTILFVTGILMVVFSGVSILMSTLVPLEAFEALDRIMPLRGMTWLTSYILESMLNIFTLVVGILGIVCSMRPEIARKCRMLGVVAIGYRIFYAILSVIALLDVPREVIAAMGGYILLGIIAWVLPVVYILAAHKVASEKTV